MSFQSETISETKSASLFSEVLFNLITVAVILIGAAKIYSVLTGVFGEQVTPAHNKLWFMWDFVLALGYVLGGIFVFKKRELGRKTIIYTTAVMACEMAYSYIVSYGEIKKTIADAYSSYPLFQDVPFPILEFQVILSAIIIFTVYAGIVFYFTRSSVSQGFQ